VQRCCSIVVVVWRRSNLKLGAQGVVAAGSTAVKVDDKYAFMAKAQAAPTAMSGAADAAWDD
jgi:hypothetical protein